MCTTSFPSAGVASPQRGSGMRRRAGTGAARLGDAGAALVHPHPDLVLASTGFDDLEVDLGDLAAEHRQIDHVDLVDTDHAVRVAEAEVGHRPIGVAPEVRPSRRFVDRVDGAHRRRWPAIVAGVVGGLELDDTDRRRR